MVHCCRALWSGVRNHVTLRMGRWPSADEVVPEPTGQLIEASVRRLDGQARDELSIEVHEPSSELASGLDTEAIRALLLGGGSNGRVCLTVVVRDDRGGWDQSF
jgi:hypothetical protein